MASQLGGIYSRDRWCKQNKRISMREQHDDFQTFKVRLINYYTIFLDGVEILGRIYWDIYSKNYFDVVFYYQRGRIRILKGPNDSSED